MWQYEIYPKNIECVEELNGSRNLNFVPRAKQTTFFIEAHDLYQFPEPQHPIPMR